MTPHSPFRYARRALALGLALSLSGTFYGALSGCYWTVSKKNPEDTFCASLAQVHLRIAELRDLRPPRTAADLRIVERTLWYDMEALRQAALLAPDAPDISALDQAIDHLDRVVDAVPESAPYEEARAAIAEPLREVGDARAKLESEARCPVPSALRR